jgi:hypothetical protein
MLLSLAQWGTLQISFSSFVEEAYTHHRRKATNEQYVAGRSVGVEREQEPDKWILRTRGKVARDLT